MLLAPILAALAVAAPTPLRLSADVDDAYALKLNPAGLGFAEGGQIRMLFARDMQNGPSDLGFYTAFALGDLITFGSQLELDAVSRSGAVARPGFGLGFGSESLAFGLSWRNAEAGDLWGLGMMWRPSRHLSFSFSSVDLAQKLGPRPYDVGLAFRFARERILLSSQWRFFHGRSINVDDGRPDIELLAAVEPIQGLFIGAQTDLHLRPSFQLGFSFEHLFAAAAARSGADRTPDLFVAELAYHTRDLPPVFHPKRVAVLELSGDLLPPARFNLLEVRFEVPVYGAVPLLLEELAQTGEIEGLLLKIGSLDLGWGRAEELRGGIEKLVAKGKRVDCLLSAAGDLELFVASACSAVATVPALPINLDGIAANIVFLADGLEMIGVQPQVVARGEYKSAPEQFTRSSMSQPQRESLGAILDETWLTLVDGIARGRKLERSAVEDLISRGTLTATAAKELRLVDDVIYPDQLEDWITRQYGRPVRYVQAQDIARPSRQRWSRRRRVALVSVDAVITGGESSDLPFGLGRQAGARTLVAVLERARLDPTIEAVVLRVDSPGGDAVASDLIARQVALLAETKPVIASFGDVAASGGYYVAAGARAIYAERTTVTGSIGIFSLGFSVEPLLAKLGVHSESIVFGRGANRASILHNWTPEEREITEREIDALYGQFLRVVAQGRNLPAPEVRKHAEGRIWTGAAAKERGLVDELGGLVDAVARARAEAGIEAHEEVDILVLPRSRTSLPEVVRGVLGADDAGVASLIPHQLRNLARSAAALSAAEGQRGIALLPFVLEVD